MKDHNASTKKRTPLIMDIKGNALDDGPGIRSVVFFKGCPLSCVWCHNPECKSVKAELSFDGNKCIACDTCVDACPEGALSKDNPGFVDRDKCLACFTCVGECPSGALSRAGEEMEIDAIVDKVLRDKPFFDNSGGGVTLSGGEAVMFIDFTATLARKLKSRNVRTLIETCGLFDCERFETLVLPYVDVIYFDLKLFDPAEHKKYCGVSNETVLSNFARLHQLSRAGDFEILPRIPLVPGITATAHNLKAIAKFLKSEGVSSARLLEYNPLWHEKARGLGLDDEYVDVKKMTQFMSRDKVDKCRAIFTDAGLSL